MSLLFGRGDEGGIYVKGECKMKYSALRREENELVLLKDNELKIINPQQARYSLMAGQLC